MRIQTAPRVLSQRISLLYFLCSENAALSYDLEQLLSPPHVELARRFEQFTLNRSRTSEQLEVLIAS